MKAQIKKRLQELQIEYQKGQERLTALEKETAGLNSTMLRISGAIQVLQEMIGEKEAEESLPSDNGIALSEKTK